MSHSEPMRREVTYAISFIWQTSGKKLSCSKLCSKLGTSDRNTYDYSQGGLEIKRNCMASAPDDEGLGDSLSTEGLYMRSGSRRDNLWISTHGTMGRCVTNNSWEMERRRLVPPLRQCHSSFRFVSAGIRVINHITCPPHPNFPHTKSRPVWRAVCRTLHSRGRVLQRACAHYTLRKSKHRISIQGIKMAEFPD
jgi:hypothetical protein